MEALCLHVAMQAWQNLIPEKSETRNGDQYSTPLPEVDEEFAYLVEWLHMAGTVGYGANGTEPLGATSIKSWAQLMKFDLTRFEANGLQRMSEAYSQITNNRASECPVEHTEEAINAVNEANMTTWFTGAKKV